MKRLFLLLMTAAMALPAAAQAPAGQISQDGQTTRDLKFMVRDRKGKTIRGLKAGAGVKGSDQMLQFDDSGDLTFRVGRGDTILLATPRTILEFPVDGVNSLTVVFRNRSNIEGYASPERTNNEMVDIGYGTISRRNVSGAVSQLNMENVDGYASLKDYMQGKVAGVAFDGDRLIIRGGMTSLVGSTEPLVVVDGVEVSSFAAANQSVPPRDVESITVLKDGSSTAMYGTRGTNGVVLIKTKSSGDRSR